LPDQLLAPMLDRLEGLPVPQRDAVRTAFGVSPRPAPDRFFVALAVLSLLSEVAEERPLICVVDDEQWLDRASAQVVAFVARCLEAESVGVVVAARRTSDELDGLPELLVEGLPEGDARALLDSVLPGPLDARSTQPQPPHVRAAGRRGGSARPRVARRPPRLGDKRRYLASR
jgi:hypothetical protein